MGDPTFLSVIPRPVGVGNRTIVLGTSDWWLGWPGLGLGNGQAYP